MKRRRIPITAAARIAEQYGYDQVIVLARRVGGPNDPNAGEAVTTYGVTKADCDAAAQVGDFLKYKVMKWPDPSAQIDAESIIK